METRRVPRPWFCLATISVTALLACGDDAAAPDTTAPSAVDDLNAVASSHASVTLTWTATGDDRGSGTATSYDIRYSTVSGDLTTPEGWEAASQVQGAPKPAAAGTEQSVVADGLNASTTYHFAIDAIDEAGNHSGISNIANATTDPPPSPLVVAAEVCILTGFTHLQDAESSVTCQSGASLRLSAAGSLDPDGGSLSFEWRGEVDRQDGSGRQPASDIGPGGVLSTADETVTVALLTTGIHYITLTVRTDDGRTASETLRITVLMADSEIGFLCDPATSQHPEQRVELCSPKRSALQARATEAGIELTFPAPPRSQTTFVSEVVAPHDSAWGDLSADQVVPGITVSGTYLNVVDQRIQLEVLMIGDFNSDSGVVGTDRILMAWSSAFVPFGMDLDGGFTLDNTYQGEALQLGTRDRNLGVVVDTTQVAGVRVAFGVGMEVGRGWLAVFDVEDFDGFMVWRWLSDPTDSTVPVAVGRYDKVAASPRPRDAWPAADPLGSFTFVDRFVITGNVYHYAVVSYDRGFNPATGQVSTAGPFESPMPLGEAIDHPGPTQMRIDFRLCP